MSQPKSSGIAAPAPQAERLSQLSPQQWRSGIAAWLGWLFDGLDMHLYTLVAIPFVAQLMALAPTDPRVSQHGAIINAAFLVGWALGGAFFGRLGDLLGRSRALCLTILTYAAFTGLSSCATEWWHLLIFRFLSALGIGGEWAVGASLLSETWPKKWGPWIAATLQSAVNFGVLLACFAGYLFQNSEPRYIFLVGILPALIVLWIRKAVPETEEWHQARNQAAANPPGIADLFRGKVARTTWLTLTICAIGLTAHWTFMYWHQAHVRNLPDVVGLAAAAKNRIATHALFIIMVGSIIGNYLAGWVAMLFGYRRAVSFMLAMYFLAMMAAYGSNHDRGTLMPLLGLIGVCQGVFGLFTMCLPPLFPTLLRSTGAGFCYNIGRIVAAGGTVFFGVFVNASKFHADDYRKLLFYAGFLFIPGMLVAMLLPEKPAVQSDARD
jgi:MFS family permease